jgi:sulfide:quinone oxidoreductase
MKLAHITDNFAVSPQLRPEDMRSLAEEGFETIISNRPDGEEAGQPTAETMRHAAEAAGLSFHHIPIAGGEFPPVAIEAFAKVRQEANGKIVAYCRTGTRSITLDTLANIEKLDAVERIERARRAGYDLSAIQGRLSD